MFQKNNNLFTPIRSTVGSALPFTISLKHSSPQARDSGLEKGLKIIKRNTFDEASKDPQLLKFWPNIITVNSDGDKNIFKGDSKQPVLIAPDPFHQPFLPESPYSSIFASADHGATTELAQSRKFKMVFEVKLRKTKLVGGIAFMGYPSLGANIDKFGLTSSNYGLPREMRMSIGSNLTQGTHENRFIDSDVHHTKQVMNYSSGFHYFHVEPTLTNRFTLQISDFPLLLKTLSIIKGEHMPDYAYGLVIPFLYVFAYKEQVRYHHRVPGGVVGTVGKTDHSQKIQGLEWQRLIKAEKDIYQIYPASSIFRDRRAYLHLQFDPGFLNTSTNLSALEQFVSRPLEKGESISLICQQCDQTLRSIAGMELIIPVTDANLTHLSEDQVEQSVGLPADEVNSLDKVGVKIFELDFPAGVSPLEARNPKLSKYKKLLAKKSIANDDSIDIGAADDAASSESHSPDHRSIRFTRPSNLRYFEIELTNQGGTTGQAVVLSAQFIQSAHITLHPKLSSHLAVPRMHFRIVGDDLLEDYSQIGLNGFNFSVERLAAGQPVQQLISMHSLADLMQSGVARVISNSRRRAVEFEKSKVYDQGYQHPGVKEPPSRVLFPDETNPNFHVTQTLDRGRYWHKTNSGKKTFPNEHQISEVDFQNSTVFSRFLDHHDSEMVKNYKQSMMSDEDNQGNDQFETYATTQSGVHSEYLFPDSSDWGSVKSYFNSVEQFASFLPDGNIVPASPATLLTRISEMKYWNGINTHDLLIRGLSNYFLHPGNLTGTMSNSSPSPMNYGQILALAQMVVQGDIDLNEFLERLIMLLFSNTSNTASSSPGLGLNTLMFFGGSGGSISGNLGAAIGAGVSGSAGLGASVGIQSPFPGVQYTNTMGSQGIVTQQSDRTAFSYSKTLNDQARTTMNFSSNVAGENKRIVERRAVPSTDRKRLKGAEVMWQGQLKDIILGTIPLDVSFPAYADRSVIASDEAVRVRFGNGIGEDIEADFWFEINETEVKDDF